MAEEKTTAGKRRRNLLGVFIKDRKGATAVEFALVATPFLALVVALIQTFLVFFAQSILENTVRQAARQILTGQTQTADAGLSSTAVAPVRSLMKTPKRLRRLFPAVVFSSAMVFSYCVRLAVLDATLMNSCVSAPVMSPPVVTLE